MQRRSGVLNVYCHMEINRSCIQKEKNQFRLQRCNVHDVTIRTVSHQKVKALNFNTHNAIPYQGRRKQSVDGQAQLDVGG